MFVNDWFKIRGWDKTGRHVGSARQFGGSIGTLVTTDAGGPEASRGECRSLML